MYIFYGAISTFFIVILIYILLKQRKIEKSLKQKNNELKEKLDFLRVILDTIPESIFAKDLQGRYTECNVTFAESMNLKKEEIINKTLLEISEDGYLNKHVKIDRKIMKIGGKQIYESKFKNRFGKFKDTVVTKAAIISKEGKIKGLAGVMIDITELKESRNRIKKLLEIREAMLYINQSIIGMNNIKDLFNLILEKAIGVMDKAKYGSILIVDKDNMVRISSSKGYDIEKVKHFKIPLEESFVWIKTKGDIKNTVIINDVNELVGEDVIDLSKEEEKWKIKSLISTPIYVDNKFYGMLNIDSNEKNAFNEYDAEILEYMKSQIEIAMSKHSLYNKIIYLSRFDKLTNVYNRRYFEEKFKCILKENQEFYFVMFDLNRLKFVNDKFGHIEGDNYIRYFTSNLKNRMRESNILARYGGDEFVGIYFDIDKEKLIEKIENLKHFLKTNPLRMGNKEIICSFSYGISSFPKDSVKGNKLIKYADERMYIYKKREKTDGI